jgi:hypothetical protein
MPSKKWGKYLIALFVILSALLITTSLLMQVEIHQEHISSVQYDRLYSQSEYQDIRTDLITEEMPALAVSVIPHLILMGILVGAFLNIRKMENDCQPRMDDRLKDLKL